MGESAFYSCRQTSMVNAVPLKLLKISLKFKNFVIYTLKMGKVATVLESEKMYDIIFLL